MNTKSLSFKQVWWAQEFSRYHSQIDYRQRKANVAADALSRFHHCSRSEEKELRIENTQILHWLQSLLINASLAGPSLSSHTTRSQAENLSPLHQVLICDTYVLPWLCQF